MDEKAVNELVGIGKKWVESQEKERKAKNFRWMALILIGVVYFVINLTVFIKPDWGFKPSEYVAVVKMDGTIGANKILSAANYTQPLSAAFSDPKAVGVVLIINSLGGQPAQSQLIHDLIKRYKEKHDKKVIVVAEDALTSGAYMIAVAADKIYAPTTSLVGSIGVVIGGYDFSEFAEKHGIKDRTYTAGEYKAPFNPLEAPSEWEKAKVGQLLNDLHGEFIRMVQEGRGDRIGTEANLFTGESWSGLKAKEYGLIDGHLDFQTTLNEEFGTEKWVLFKPKLNSMNLLQLLIN